MGEKARPSDRGGLATIESIVDEAINACVAVGTIAVAIIGGLSMRQTRAVLAEDDRRFRLGLAPIVLATGFFGSDAVSYDEFDTGVRLTNSGAGIAMQINVEMVAYFLRYKKGFSPNDVPPEDIDRERYPGAEPWIVTDNLAALAAGESRVADFWSSETPGFQRGLIEVTSLCITYTDMFGSAYETRYERYPFTRYRWGQVPGSKAPR